MKKKGVNSARLTPHQAVKYFSDMLREILFCKNLTYKNKQKERYRKEFTTCRKKFGGGYDLQ